MGRRVLPLRFPQKTRVYSLLVAEAYAIHQWHESIWPRLNRRLYTFDGIIMDIWILTLFLFMNGGYSIMYIPFQSQASCEQVYTAVVAEVGVRALPCTNMGINQ